MKWEEHACDGKRCFREWARACMIVAASWIRRDFNVHTLHIHTLRWINKHSMQAQSDYNVCSVYTPFVLFPIYLTYCSCLFYLSRFPLVCLSLLCCLLLLFLWKFLCLYVGRKSIRTSPRASTLNQPPKRRTELINLLCHACFDGIFNISCARLALCLLFCFFDLSHFSTEYTLYTLPQFVDMECFFSALQTLVATCVCVHIVVHAMYIPCVLKSCVYLSICAIDREYCCARARSASDVSV